MLEGKVAFITGAARGQGRAHAIACAREGADVVLADVYDVSLPHLSYALATESDMSETAKEVDALGRQALTFDVDVRSQSKLDAAVAAGIAEFGHIDILIANAGIWAWGPFWEITEEAWEDMLAINLTGVWKSAKAVAPHMIERKLGSIVITSSSNGLEPGFNYAHYASSKHGVIGLMKNIALELAPHGVRCNAICPGAVETPMINQPKAIEMMLGRTEYTQDDVAFLGSAYHALKGTAFQQPADIADAAALLNSDFARTITGVALAVDSGHQLLTGMNMAPQV